MSTQAKLNKLLKTKEDIRLAIQNKGGSVGEVFSEYPAAIKSLEAGKINVKDEGLKFASSRFEEIPSRFDFSDVTDASQMFNGNINLKNVKNFNVENVEDFTSTFYNCTGLEDISGLKITNSTKDLYRTFHNCVSLKTIDLSNWDTSNVTDMYGTFADCESLTKIDITPLDLSKVTSIGCLFESCGNLSTIKGVIDIPAITSSFSSSSTPFRYCYVLRNFDGMRHNNTMYYDTCYLLTEQSVKNIFNVIPEVSGNRTLYFIQDVVNQMNDEDIAIATNKGWTVSPAKSISEPVIVSDLSVIPSSTRLITPKTYDFSQYTGSWNSGSYSTLPCRSSIYEFTGDLSNTTNASYMFGFCQSLRNAQLTNTSNITDMTGILDGCSKLEQVYIEDTANVDNMAYMLYGCSNLTKVNLSEWDVSKVTSMLHIFTNCDSLVDIDVSGWNTSSLKTTQGMFANCDILESVNFGYCDLSNVENMSFMFSECPSLRSVTMYGAVNADISQLSQMFYKVESEGTFYYNPAYDYSKIIAELPETWTAVPLTEE